LPELPFGITSFGAAGIGDSIYVFGGHTGTAHSYWNTSQSNQLLRWNLSASDGSWEVVSEGPHRLQGLAMVAHGTRLILVGGFFAKNEEGEPHELFSQDQVAVFDTATDTWSELPNLPSARSSHDAIVHDDKLYVVGGWNMSGPDATQWHDTALVMDLKAAMPKWEQLPNPGFNRRALALAAFDGKIFAVGGMERQGGPTRKTSVFDPLTQQWSDGPELLGTEGMVGFGASSWPIDGRLVTTTYDGSVQVLSADHKSWLAVGKTDDARFFHRMLPYRAGHLVLVGGSNMESGKFLQPEVLRIEASSGVATR
jgi:N-acetylneuraminic acid mutarotase